MSGGDNVGRLSESIQISPFLNIWISSQRWESFQHLSEKNYTFETLLWTTIVPHNNAMTFKTSACISWHSGPTNSSFLNVRFIMWHPKVPSFPAAPRDTTARRLNSTGRYDAHRFIEKSLLYVAKIFFCLSQHYQNLMQWRCSYLSAFVSWNEKSEIRRMKGCLRRQNIRILWSPHHWFTLISRITFFLLKSFSLFHINSLL